MWFGPIPIGMGLGAPGWPSGWQLAPRGQVYQLLVIGPMSILGAGIIVVSPCHMATS